MRDHHAARIELPLPDEAPLVQRAKSGDSEAFAQLYDAYVARVYRYIYFRVTDDAAAEDAETEIEAEVEVAAEAESEASVGLEAETDVEAGLEDVEVDLGLGLGK